MEVGTYHERSKNNMHEEGEHSVFGQHVVFPCALRKYPRIWPGGNEFVVTTTILTTMKTTIT